MIHVPCPLCGSDDAFAVAQVADYTEPFRNVICRRCALVYADPQPTPEELSAYYKRQFIQGRHQIASIDEARERARKKGSQAKYPIDGLRDGIGAGSRVLEIGCSYGFLLNAIKTGTAATVEGVEPSEVSGSFAETEFGFPVFHGTVEEYLATPVKTTYDLIIISHVLEHLADPVAMLQAIRRRLTPGGRLYVCVPDVTHLQEPTETFFQVPHLTSFSPWTLFLVLWAAGFKPLSLARRLKAPKSGMEFFAAAKDDPRPALSMASVREGRDPAEVVGHLKATARKYGAMRGLKRVASAIVPRERLERLSVAVRRKLRAAQDAK